MTGDARVVVIDGGHAQERQARRLPFRSLLGRKAAFNSFCVLICNIREQAAAGMVEQYQAVAPSVLHDRAAADRDIEVSD